MKGDDVRIALECANELTRRVREILYSRTTLIESECRLVAAVT
jgi:hypothetical protein